jgi:hypothetical protein
MNHNAGWQSETSELLPEIPQLYVMGRNIYIMVELATAIKMQ